LFGSILGFVRLSLGVLHLFGADTTQSVIIPVRALKALLTNHTLTIAARETVYHNTQSPIYHRRIIPLEKVAIKSKSAFYTSSKVNRLPTSTTGSEVDIPR
jgi:hypothetical protein